MQQPSVSVLDHTSGFAWRPRLRAAAIHLGFSALVAALAAWLVFGLWYPYPYREISGGSELFRLIVAVDVVLGPLITLAVFNLAKPRKELRRDLAVVVCLQLTGLAYGLHAVQIARPVHLVHEIDRFRVVHHSEIPAELLDKAPSGVNAMPWTGPTLLGLRPFRDQSEKAEFTLAALSGVHLGARPELWQPYEASRNDVLQAAKPVAELKRRFPGRTSEIDAALREAGATSDQAAYLPLIARKADAWTVLLDASTAKVIGFIPLDSF